MDEGGPVLQEATRPQQSWAPRGGAAAPEVWVLFWRKAPSTHQIFKETQIPERFGVSLAEARKLSVVKSAPKYTKQKLTE